MKRGFSLASTLITVLALQALGQGSSPDFKDIEPGHYVCWSAGGDGGWCVYQAHKDDTVYGDLLKHVINVFPEWTDKEGFNPANKPPAKGIGAYTIEWWYVDSKNGGPDVAKNTMIGEYLKANDRTAHIQNQTEVAIEILIYGFSRGFQRDLGFQVGAFVGKRTLDTLPPKFSQILEQGLLSLAGGIGNPLASYLNLGITAMVDRSRSEEITRTVVTCVVGTMCSPGTSNPNYYKATVDTKTDDMGLIFTTTPAFDRDDPTKLSLQGLKIAWGVATGAENSPVKTTTIVDGNRDVDLRPDELKVLMINTVDRDLKSGRLFGSDKEKNFDQTVTMIRVAKIKEGDKTIVPLELKQTDDRSYTPEERAKLGTSTIQDFLNSIDTDCAPNLITPTAQGSICGFKFNHIGFNLIDAHLHFHVDGKAKYSESRDQYMRAGDVYKDKGFYQLPMLDDSSASDYTLTVEFDRPVDSVAAEIKSEKIRGMVVPFRYYPSDHINPIVFPKDQAKNVRRWLKP
jgi:hypothetical protein